MVTTNSSSKDAEPSGEPDELNVMRTDSLYADTKLAETLKVRLRQMDFGENLKLKYEEF
ncbi:MAG: hypothetical protein NTV34_02520 [Proteobacteria bacterium]|nr:hypothetical protein [Pseudomonadota bacterium]